MIKRTLILALLAQTPAAYAEDLAGQAQAYMSEAIAAAKAQAALGKREVAPEFSRLIDEDQRWMNEKIKPGQGVVLTHLALYGAIEGEVLEVQLAEDAARVRMRLRYSELPGSDWSTEVDFIRIRGEWKLRALALSQRRLTPVDAAPETVLLDWLTAQKERAVRSEQLDPASWLHETLGRHWAIGGGGYWRQVSDCREDARKDCLNALGSIATLWAAATLDREKTINVIEFRGHPDKPTGIIEVNIPRRTMVETRRFKVTLARDRRHGWQIASLAPITNDSAPETVEISADQSSGEALVRSLVVTLLGEGAPDATALLGNPDILEPYFTDTRDGRKAMAQMITMKSFFLAFKVDPTRPVIEDLGDGRLQLSFEGQKPSAPRPVFVITETADGARIAGIEN